VVDRPAPEHRLVQRQQCLLHRELAQQQPVRVDELASVVARAPPVETGRPADHETVGDGEVRRRAVLLAHRDDGRRGERRLTLHVLVDRGEAGRSHGRHPLVVEAGHENLVRYAHPGVRECVQDAER